MKLLKLSTWALALGWFTAHLFRLKQRAEVVKITDIGIGRWPNSAKIRATKRYLIRSSTAASRSHEVVPFGALKGLLIGFQESFARRSG